MASKAEPKITRRQVDNLRAESMRQASYLMSRVRMSVLGKPAIKKCDCGNEYELFPNQPTKLDTAQVNAAKFEIDKIYPGINEEELDKVTGEVMTEAELAEQIAELITDPSTYVLVSVEAMAKAIELMQARLANVIPIKAGTKEGVETRH